MVCCARRKEQCLRVNGQVTAWYADNGLTMKVGRSPLRPPGWLARSTRLPPLPVLSQHAVVRTSFVLVDPGDHIQASELLSSRLVGSTSTIVRPERRRGQANRFSPRPRSAPLRSARTAVGRGGSRRHAAGVAPRGDRARRSGRRRPRGPDRRPGWSRGDGR
jgi:hypothetical protein